MNYIQYKNSLYNRLRAWFSHCRKIGFIEVAKYFLLGPVRNYYKEPAPQDAILQYVRFKNGSMEIECFVASEPNSDSVMVTIRNTKGEILEKHNASAECFYYIGRKVSGYRFRFIISDTTPIGSYVFSFSQNDTNKALSVSAGIHFPVSPRYKTAYFVATPCRLVRISRQGFLIVENKSLFKHAARELIFCTEVLLTPSFEGLLAVMLRSVSRITKLFMHQRIWLFSDKLTNPFDSAYYTAKALVDNPQLSEKRIELYYVSDTTYLRRNKIKMDLPTVRYRSLKHLMIALIAEVNVTSEGGYNPFIPRTAPYIDLLAHQMRVWSGHGIIHHDLSTIYGKDIQNFNLLALSVERERSYLLSGLWSYDDDELALTGLSRWDVRASNPQKIICFMFTWRANLVADLNPVTQERFYSPSFSDSQYCREISSLLSSNQLIEAASQKGYKLVFVPHPLVISALPYFGFPENIKIVVPGSSNNMSYEDIYSQTSLLVTDYSSVAMDMAYLGKPVIYFQFDREVFYATQGYTQSFFSWDNDGFGEVLATEEAVVGQIMTYLETNCSRQEPYNQRARQFFTYRDNKNGRRTVAAILEALANKK